MIVCTSKELSLDDELKDLILDELNVEQIEILHNADEYVSYELKPQLRTVGPKYGKLLGGIREYLATNGSAENVNKVRAGGSLNFEVGGQEVELAEADLLIGLKNKEGYASETNGEMTVVLDTILTEQLIQKGMVKEFISKVQNLRKESGFEVVNHIKIALNGDKDLTSTLLEFADTIKKGTLCDQVYIGNDGESTMTFEFDGKSVDVKISRV